MPPAITCSARLPGAVLSWTKAVFHTSHLLPTININGPHTNTPIYTLYQHVSIYITL